MADKKNIIKEFTPIDGLFIGYMAALSLLIIFFHRGVNDWYFYIAVHSIIVFLIIFFIPKMNRSGSGLIEFFRWWYPGLLFSFNYKEINSFTHILVKGWKDIQIVNFEKIFFPVAPTLWLDKIASPVLTEIMKFDYFTYYLMLPAGAAFLYFRGKRQHYVRYLSTACLAFYISYIGFIVYPVRGPRYAHYDKYTKDYDVNIKEFYGPFVDDDMKDKNTKALKGYFFTDMQDTIMRYGSLHGGCMPSSHIAVAFVCMMLMRIYRRRIFYVYLPLVTLLCVAVVYNRYHYFSDVAAGIVVGIVSLYLAPKLMELWGHFTGYEKV